MSNILEVTNREVKVAPNSLNLEGKPRQMAVLTVTKHNTIKAQHPVTGADIMVAGRPVSQKVVQFLEPGTSTSGDKLSADPFGNAPVGSFIQGDIITRIEVPAYRGTDGREYTTITATYLGSEMPQDFLTKQVERHTKQVVAQDRLVVA
jgi:hypothetical protein